MPSPVAPAVAAHSPATRRTKNGPRVSCVPTRPPRTPARHLLHRSTDHAHPLPRKSRIHTPFEIGKYLVSPLIKRLADGRYAPSVSIRTGRGSATHDRVLRLLPVFDTPQAASRYATDQGIAWVSCAAAA